jgi:uncharacterized membrane protein YfcA
VTLSAILVTLVAGVAMGWINNVAGGAGMFAFWALQYACGLPFELANPTSRVAAVAIGLFSFLGYLRAGQRTPLRAWLLGLAATPGAFYGTQLAMRLPEWSVRTYLGVVMLLLLWQQRRPAGPRASALRPLWVALLGCQLIGAHMGFVQVGTGLVATLVLAASYTHDLVAVNAAKSAIVIATSLTSVGSFAANDFIAWVPGLWLAAGASVGSYLASAWSVRKGSEAVRRMVLAIIALSLVEQAVYFVWGI